MKIRIIILIIFVFSPLVAIAEPVCFDPLKSVSSNIDMADSKILTPFLLTFSNSKCHNNVEHSEWGNKLIFKVMEKRSTQFFKTFFQLHENERLAIVSEIISPLLDANWQLIVTSINESSLIETEKNRALQLIKKAYKQDMDKQKVRVKEFDT